MRRTLLFPATLLLAASLPWQANAGTVGFSFAGPGVSGTVDLTYGLATDGKYPQAFEVTGISGTFSDSNNSLDIVNAAIGPLVPINHAAPEATNLLAPDDFSKFAVTSGLPVDNNGFLTYDNLYYPGGSPQTASDYPAQGGFLDIYGLLASILAAFPRVRSTSGATVPSAPAALVPSITAWRSLPPIHHWTTLVVASR